MSNLTSGATAPTPNTGADALAAHVWETKCKASENFADILDNTEIVKTASNSANQGYIFPTDGLPQQVVDYCKHIADCRNVPIEVVVMAALTVAGASAGGYVESEIAGRYNRPQLWTMIVAPSTAGKSQPLADIMKPLYAIDNAAIKKYSDSLALWQEANAKTPNPTPKPKKTQFICNAKTDAARLEFICDNQRGGIIYRDELRALFKDLSGAHCESGIEDLLEIADCKPIKIHTKTSDEIKTSDFSFLPILGGIQPRVLKSTIKPDYIDNGLLNRFSAICFDRKGIPPIGGNVDPRQSEAWNNIVLKLRDCGNTAWVYHASPEAMEAYREEHDRYFTQGFTSTDETPEEEKEHREAVWSKTLITIHRLALIAHLLHIVTQSTCYPYPKPEINPDTIQWAFKVGVYLCNEQMKVYNMIVGKTAPKRLTNVEVFRTLGRWLKQEGKEINRQQLADALGMDRGNLSRNLDGK